VRITVCDHATRRYRERVADLPLEEAKNAITNLLGPRPRIVLELPYAPSKSLGWLAEISPGVAVVLRPSTTGLVVKTVITPGGAS
jgi:hypothetical protein